MSDLEFKIKAPDLGESVVEAIVARSLKKTGEHVAYDETFIELETEKVNLDIASPCFGIIKELFVKEGDTVHPEQLLAIIEQVETKDKTEHEAQSTAESTDNPTQVYRPELISESEPSEIKRHVRDNRELPPPLPSSSNDRLTKRIPLSPLRKTVARRLKEAQNTAAILTTFNEIDMSFVLSTKKKYQDAFFEKHKIKLGLTSFFVKSVIEALKQVPALNAHIEGDDIVSKNYYDIGVAVASPRGLVVPVIQDADFLSFFEIEKAIADFSEKAKNDTLSMKDLSGGTFTITNGGVFGSLLSTPILNFPQSGILGLHKIQERPVVIDHEIVIRAMMYVALSYDHRLVDGKQAISFLLCVKNHIEDPTRFLLNL